MGVSIAGLDDFAILEVDKTGGETPVFSRFSTPLSLLEWMNWISSETGALPGSH